MLSVKLEKLNYSQNISLKIINEKCFPCFYRKPLAYFSTFLINTVYFFDDM